MSGAAKILLTEGDAPATPASGQSAFYAKTDHLFYRKDSNGNEVVVTPGLADSISDGDITHAPTGNAVFDALALKAPNLLTGYTSGAGTVAVTDTVLQAIQKLNGNFQAGNIAYGVKWATANSSPTLTKGIVVGGGVWIDSAYTSFPVQEQMKRCVKNAVGAKVYNLDAANSIYKENQTTPLRSGTATSTSAGKLVDTAANFTTAGVAVGHWVHNTTTGKFALVTAKDSDTQLAVAMDIFTSGNAYSVGTSNPQADGAVYVEVPEFHYVWTEDGTNTYILISPVPFIFRKPSAGTLVESQVHPWFFEGGVYSPTKYYSAFESIWYNSGAYKDHNGSTIGVSGDKAVSLPGFTPLTRQYRLTATAYECFSGLHAAFGSTHHTAGFYAYEAIWILMTTEYASLDGQTYLSGFTAADGWSYAYCRKTGRTMGLGNTSGGIVVDLAGLDSVLSGHLSAGLYVANSYRGIENIYGHIWKWVDGININWGSNGRVYLSNNPAQWAENTAINYEDTGDGMPTSNGYSSALFPGRLLTKSVAGGSTTYYLCDYFYQPGASAGWRGFLAGGILDAGVAAGPAYLAANNSGSGTRHASIGGRAAA